jgi:hypothetical protein
LILEITHFERRDMYVRALGAQKFLICRWRTSGRPLKERLLVGNRTSGVA